MCFRLAAQPWVTTGHTDVAQALLQNGAKPEMQDEEGERPWDWCGHCSGLSLSPVRSTYLRHDYILTSSCMIFICQLSTFLGSVAQYRIRFDACVPSFGHIVIPHIGADIIYDAFT